MTEIQPGAVVGFVGLGTMGIPMAIRLAEAGYRVQGYDVSEQAVRSWAERAEGSRPAASLDAAAAGAAAVILMLPDSAVVRGVLAGLVLPAGAAGRPRTSGRTSSSRAPSTPASRCA
jgi:3-hydroxyisobutyrate dehydrogenase-like beta-hydroxyacid dehydrogenase